MRRALSHYFFESMVGYRHFSGFSLSPQLDLKSRARVPFFLYPFILIALFTLSPTLLFPPSMWASQENSMCTFSLIKGLDTLPYPRRKAPFISPYWICLSVSVLFNFALPFVFITGQQKESVGNRDNGTRSLSVPPWAMIRLGWSALPAQCSALSFHHRWHPDPPQITRKHPWPLTVATHWSETTGQRSGHNVFCTSTVFRWWVRAEGNRSLFSVQKTKLNMMQMWSLVFWPMTKAKKTKFFF